MLSVDLPQCHLLHFLPTMLFRLGVLSHCPTSCSIKSPRLRISNTQRHTHYDWVDNSFFCVITCNLSWHVFDSQQYFRVFSLIYYSTKFVHWGCWPEHQRCKDRAASVLLLLLDATPFEKLGIVSRRLTACLPKYAQWAVFSEFYWVRTNLAHCLSHWLKVRKQGRQTVFSKGAPLRFLE